MTATERTPLARGGGNKGEERRARDSTTARSNAAAACVGVVAGLAVIVVGAGVRGDAVASRTLGVQAATSSRPTPVDGTYRLRNAAGCALASATEWETVQRNYVTTSGDGGYACGATCGGADTQLTTRRLHDGNYTLSTREKLCSVTTGGAFSCALDLVGTDDTVPDEALFRLDKVPAYVGAEQPSARCLRESSYTINSFTNGKFCVDDGAHVSCSSDTSADVSARWFFVDAASCPPLAGDGI